MAKYYPSKDEKKNPYGNIYYGDEYIMLDIKEGKFIKEDDSNYSIWALGSLMPSLQDSLFRLRIHSGEYDKYNFETKKNEKAKATESMEQLIKAFEKVEFASTGFCGIIHFYDSLSVIDKTTGQTRPFFINLQQTEPKNLPAIPEASGSNGRGYYQRSVETEESKLAARKAFVISEMNVFTSMLIGKDAGLENETGLAQIWAIASDLPEDKREVLQGYMAGLNQFWRS